MEDVALKYVDLCVDLKKGRYAKDGLIHYRNLCQQVRRERERERERGSGIPRRALIHPSIPQPRPPSRERRSLTEKRAPTSSPCTRTLSPSQINVASLETVVTHFLDSASARADAARAASDEVAAADLAAVDDLDEDTTPEALTLACVSGDKAADRADREAVTPWLRFLWDAHRTCLDVLRNNARTETLYAAVAGRAFTFCSAFARPVEFRRLCDVLRAHLANLAKYRDARDRPDLSNPDTVAAMLATRFDQLRVAGEMGLWQEAFRSVEDVQGVLALSGRRSLSLRPGLMAGYYSQLTRIFAVAGAHLYTGYAWYRLFLLARATGAAAPGGGAAAPAAVLAPEDAAALATNVALAALCAPPVDPSSAARSEAEADAERERAARVAALLGFAVERGAGKGRDGAGGGASARPALSRSALVAELTTRGVLSLVPAPVRAVYALLESEWAPLDLCARLAPLLDEVCGPATEDGEKKAAFAGPLAPVSPACPVPSAADLSSYRAPLQRAAVLRTLQQLGRVYSSLPLTSLAALVPFLSPPDLEAAIADAARRGGVPVRIDHRSGVALFDGPAAEVDGVAGALALAARRLAAGLAAAGVAPPGADAAEAKAAAAVAAARASATQDNARALARRVVIERRKEEAERAALAAEREEEAKRAEAARLADAAEAERRRLAAARREEERLSAELEEREAEEARAMLAAAAKQGKAIKVKDPAAPLDKRALMAEAASEATRARVEAEKRLARTVKTLDHFERARREAEAPLLAAAVAARAAEDEKAFGDGAAEYATSHRAAWEADTAERARLVRADADAEAFAAAVSERRAGEFAARAAADAAAAAAAKAASARDRDIARKREYVRRCRVEIEAKRRAEAEAEEAAAAVREAREADAARERSRAAEAAAASREGGPGGGGSGYVPPSRRTGGGFVPPALRGAGPPAGDRPPPPPAGEEGGGGSRWAPRARAGTGDAPPPLPAREDSSASGGKWVPSARRAAAAPPPASSAPREEAPRDAPPARRW